MTTSYRRPWFASLLVALVLSCSQSSTSGSCGGAATTATCEIDTTATTCPDRITLECHDGAQPFSGSQCHEALTQDTEVIYCCDNDAEPDSDGMGGGG